jgi:hypothetical protein
MCLKMRDVPEASAGDDACFLSGDPIVCLACEACTEHCLT